jgi:hypothetical protein
MAVNFPLRTAFAVSFFIFVDFQEPFNFPFYFINDNTFFFKLTMHPRDLSMSFLGTSSFFFYGF